MRNDGRAHFWTHSNQVAAGISTRSNDKCSAHNALCRSLWLKRQLVSDFAHGRL